MKKSKEGRCDEAQICQRLRSYIPTRSLGLDEHAKDLQALEKDRK
jgi:hypothetical protein